MDREKALAKDRWERKNVFSFLDNKGIKYLNPDYVHRELIDNKVIETMPNKVKPKKEK